MFGRKKPAPKPPRASGSQARQQLSDLGLFDVGGTLVDPAAGNDDDDDVAGLEAELNRLVMGEDDSPGKKARQAASELIPAMLRKETGSTSAGPPPQMARAFSRDDPIQLPESPEDLPKADATTFEAPPPPATVLEALDQRLKRYRHDESRAKEEGNASRVRRLGRICKQYEDAVKLAKAGKLPLEELPTPPGFAPIPFFHGF